MLNQTLFDNGISDIAKAYIGYRVEFFSYEYHIRIKNNRII